MPPEPPDTQFFAELRDLNLAFLRLVTDPRAGTAGLETLGLTEPAAAALQSLPAQRLRAVAAAPVLLAELSELPGPGGIAEPPPVAPGLHPQWWQAVGFFAAGLMTYLWQLARRRPVAASLCLGPAPEPRESLAGLSCEDMLSRSTQAVYLLRARPCLATERLLGWVRHARAPANAAAAGVGLDLIALGLAELRPAAAGRRHR